MSQIKLLDTLFPNYKILPEPVDQITILQDHYKTGKYAFHLQLEFFLARARIWENLRSDTTYFTERTPASEKVFSDTYNEMGMMNDWERNYLFNLDEYIYDWKRSKADIIFYLCTPIDICIENIKKRNREGEKDSFFTDKEFMNQLEDNYSDFLRYNYSGSHVYQIESTSPEERIKSIMTILEQHYLDGISKGEK